MVFLINLPGGVSLVFVQKALPIITIATEEGDLGCFRDLTQAPSVEKISEFWAGPHVDSIMVGWTTVIELDLLGFNLYRSEVLMGEPILVNNDGLIPSHWPDNVLGSDYQFIDENIEPGIKYFYWLEAVDLEFRPDRYGPVEASFWGSIYLPMVVK
jgi:hypothetical protein